MMTLTQLHCIGLNHRTASVAWRECLVVPRPEGSEPGLQEWVILATCSRFELYGVGPGEAVSQQLQAILARALTGHPWPNHDLTPHLYTYQGPAAAQHLLDVAAGLDSLILGEPQILGQVSQAYQAAQAQGQTGPVLGALFSAAIRAGKRARTETAISHRAANLSSVALTQAQKWVGSLQASSVLVIGTGEMARLALKALAARQVTRLALANRTPAHTLETWEWFERTTGRRRGGSWTLEQLPEAAAAADVIISAAAAPHFLLDVPLVAAVVAHPGRRLALIDLALPRTIDPAVRHLPAVHLLDVDQVREELGAALLERQQAVPEVEAILRAEYAALERQLQQLTIQPVLVAWREQAEMIRQQEVQRALRRLGEVDQRTHEQLQHLSQALVNQLLHTPTLRLKQEASAGRAAPYVAAVRHLFGLAGEEI